MTLRWFRVEDTDRNQLALVRGADAKDTGRAYLEQYRPDLYTGFAHDDEIDDGEAHPVPGPTAKSRNGSSSDH